MCTLIAIHRRVPGCPLVVAANRDEYLDRPAEGPAIRTTRAGSVVAPLDVRAGGTWLGVGGGPRAGIFAALTNLRNPNPDPTRKSRGWVVMEALEAGTAEAAAEALGRLPERSYNPFNCYLADADQAFLVVYEEAPRLYELKSGVHVIGNIDAAEATSPKVERIREQADRAARLPREDVFDALAKICREHGTSSEPLTDTCVHVADTYGTRSSMLIELAERSDESRMLYSDGPPCKSQYQDFSSLLHGLMKCPDSGAAEMPMRTAS